VFISTGNFSIENSRYFMFEKCHEKSAVKENSFNLIEKVFIS